MEVSKPGKPGLITGAADDSGAGAGFEAVLAAAAYDGIGALAPPADLSRLARAVLRNPVPPARSLAGLALRLGAIGWGSAAAGPAGEGLDRRFADPAWAGNPVLNRIALSYLAYCDTTLGILQDVDVDWRTRERLRLLADNLLAAASPTNNLLSNPSSWKRLIDTGGGSLRAGLANLVHDLRSPAKLPASVDKTAFTLGKDLAATPGKVVRRSRLYELIEYQPVTQSVDVVPVVMIASPVNKYYLLDLEPAGSVVRAELERGRRVFVVSWVNPDESHADAGFDAYVAGIVEVLQTAAEIAGTEAAHLLGLCGGGQLVLLAAAYLAAIGRQHELATLTIGIAVADYARGPATMAFLDRRTAGKAIERATARGYFDAVESARAFALIRPNDGIWANVVNNYLLGQEAAGDGPAVLGGGPDQHRRHVSVATRSRPSWTTPSPSPEESASSACRSTPGRSPSTPTFSAVRPTTSPRGETASGPSRCSAGRRPSCSPGGDTRSWRPGRRAVPGAATGPAR